MPRTYINLSKITRNIVLKKVNQASDQINEKHKYSKNRDWSKKKGLRRNILRKRESLNIATKSVDYIAWRRFLLEKENEHFVSNHDCPHCKKALRVTPQHATFVDKVGWVHLSCGKYLLGEKLEGEKKEKPEHHSNRNYFRESLKKCLKAQLPLWEPPKEKIWDEKFFKKFSKNLKIDRKLCEEPGYLPLRETVILINKEVGWEIISKEGYEALRNEGIFNLHRFRVMNEDRWKRLSFDAETRATIVNKIGREEDLAFKMMQSINKDIKDSHIIDLKPSVPVLTNSEITQSLELAPLIQREVDKEELYSPLRNFNQTVTALPRPHAKKIIPDKELYRKPSFLENASFDNLEENEEYLKKALENEKIPKEDIAGRLRNLARRYPSSFVFDEKNSEQYKLNFEKKGNLEEFEAKFKELEETLKKSSSKEELLKRIEEVNENDDDEMAALKEDILINNVGEDGLKGFERDFEMEMDEDPGDPLVLHPTPVDPEMKKSIWPSDDEE